MLTCHMWTAAHLAWPQGPPRARAQVSKAVRSRQVANLEALILTMSMTSGCVTLT